MIFIQHRKQLYTKKDDIFLFIKKKVCNKNICYITYIALNILTYYQTKQNIYNNILYNRYVVKNANYHINSTIINS